MKKNLSLAQICLLYNTDKNTYHCYVDEVYEDLFKTVRDSTKKLLEIGVDTGASLFMWKDYFHNANIVGLDNKICPQAEDEDRIKHIVKDAYNYETLELIPDDFDIIIDDGPHTLDSMLFLIQEYSKKINDTGILIIEDIQDFHWVNILKSKMPDGFNVKVKDLREIRNRYDDIIMIITKA